MNENKFSQKNLKDILKKYRKKYKIINIKENEKFDFMKTQSSFYKLIKEIPFFINFRKQSLYHRNNDFGFLCFYIIKQPIIRY